MNHLYINFKLQIETERDFITIAVAYLIRSNATCNVLNRSVAHQANPTSKLGSHGATVDEAMLK